MFFLHICSLWILLSQFCHLALPQSHFVKDQKIDAHVFPPMPEYQIASLPPGHLRPLGFQRPSDGKVKQFSRQKNGDIFQEKIVEVGIPVKVGDHYTPPAAELWGEKYLAKKYGNNPVDVMMPDVKTKNGTSVVQMPLIQFLRKYHYENWVVHGTIPEKMKTDLTVPKHLQCPSLLGNIQEVRLWISSGPVGAPLAYRPDHQLWCALSGRADMFISKPDFNQHLQFIEKVHPKSGVGESNLDVNMINMYQNPTLENVAWNWATMVKSDCVFIPAKHSYQVRSYGRSYFVIFDIMPQLQYSTCANLAPIDDYPMTKAKTNWILTPSGEKIFNMDHEKKWSVPRLQRALSAILRDHDRLNVEEFTHFWMHGNTQESRSSAEKAFGAFKVLDPNGAGHVTRKTVDGMKLTDWTKIVTLINSENERPTIRDEL